MLELVKEKVEEYFKKSGYRSNNLDTICSFIEENNLKIFDENRIRPIFFTDYYKYSVICCDKKEYNKLKIPEILESRAIFNGFIRSRVLDVKDNSNFIILNEKLIIVDEESYIEDPEIDEKVNVIYSRLKRKFKSVKLIDARKFYIHFKCDNRMIYFCNSDINVSFTIDKSIRCLDLEDCLVLDDNIFIDFKSKKEFRLSNKVSLLKFLLDNKGKEWFSEYLRG